MSLALNEICRFFRCFYATSWKENVQIEKQKGFRTLRRLKNEDKTSKMKLQGYKDFPENQKY